MPMFSKVKQELISVFHVEIQILFHFAFVSESDVHLLKIKFSENIIAEIFHRILVCYTVHKVNPH
jgi:hypothetical protein